MTVTVKLHVLALPDVSPAVQVTVVTPLAKLDPEAGEQVTVAPGQLSETLGVAKVTTAEHCVGAVLEVMLGGHAPMTGA